MNGLMVCALPNCSNGAGMGGLRHVYDPESCCSDPSGCGDNAYNAGYNCGRSNLLTAEELAILDLLSEAATRYGRLPEHHPSERAEWAADTHRLQEKIMCRAAIRAYPDRFTPMRSTHPDQGMAR